MQLVPLELLGPGEQGRIVEVDGERDLVARLAEMGLCQGAEIRMLRPGSPCIIALGNQRMSFRGDETVAVLVDVGEGP